LLYEQIRFIGLNITVSELESEKICFSFLINAVINFQKESWIGLCEKKEELLHHVFDKLKIAHIYIIVENDPVIISFKKWEKLSSSEADKILPTITESKYILKGTFSDRVIL